MKRIVSLLTTLTMIALLTGCLEVSIDLNVKKDGSGTIIVSNMMSAKTLAQMEVMSGGKKLGEKELHQVQQLKSSASNFGDNVKFVSSKFVENADGSKGAVAVYSFDDINKVNIKGKAATGSMGAKPKKDEGLPWKFKFDKASKKLTIVGLKKGTDVQEKSQKKLSDSQIQMQMQQMKMMGKGMKISISIKGADKIKSSTATHFDKKANTVTLMLFDLNSIIDDDDKLRKLIMADGPESMADPNMPGVKAQDPTKDAVIQL